MQLSCCSYWIQKGSPNENPVNYGMPGRCLPAVRKTGAYAHSADQQRRFTVEYLNVGHISFIIKALNEEVHIKRCIESILAVRAKHDVEIILADSKSTDNTVAYASGYDIDIVQLERADDRSCGVGGQLGYQHSTGEFVYLIDGDMEFVPTFIDEALAAMAIDPELAGVGGLVEERAGKGNYEYERRRVDPVGFRPGEVDWLNGGGLFRRSAVADVGYLTDRNLHSFEEKDLGCRLIAKGYKLKRLAVPAVGHYGKTESTGALLTKRWRSRYFDGSGELLRSAIGRPHLFLVVRLLWKLLLVCLSYVMLLIGSVFLQEGAVCVAILMHIAMFMFFMCRGGRLSTAVVAYININILTLAMIRGFFSKLKDPRSRINSVVIKSSPRSTEMSV